MITFFTIPKPMKGIYNVIQRNAILSWQQIVPKCEIIIFSDDSSVIQFSHQIGVKCISEFRSNSYGTPLLDNIWESAEKYSTNGLICYINSDIILFPDFLEKINRINLSKFLIAGRRWDIGLEKLIDYKSNWQLALKTLVKDKGALHSETGADYFLFPKSIMPKLPAFAIGRAWWDNWMFYYFKQNKVPIIDGTNIMTVHQNHDYSHIRSVSNGTSFKGIERDVNRKLAGLKYWQKVNIGDATHYYYEDTIHKKPLWEVNLKLFNRYIKRTLILIRSYLVGRLSSFINR